ncbi:hypothetical protein ABTE36_23440, partial [Acinetobacter baumannii]
RTNWVNLGGQLIPETDVLQLKKQIITNKIKSWEEVHAFYESQGSSYATNKSVHALASLQEISGISLATIDAHQLQVLL